MGRDTTDNAISQKFTIAAQLVAWLIGVFLAYSALSTRVAVTEAKVSTIQEDLHEMKGDIKQLLQRK